MNRKPNLLTGFEDGDTLRDIRLDVLNPLVAKANKAEADISDVRTTAEKAYSSVEQNNTNKTVKLHNEGNTNSFTIDLGAMFPEVPPPTFTYPLQRGDGTSINNIQTLKIGNGIEAAESHPGGNSGGTLELTVPSPWAKVSEGTYTPVKHFVIKDANNKAIIANDTLTWEIPKDYGQFMGQVGTSDAKPVNKIRLEGEISTSSITDDVMTINLSAGGGGGTTVEGYFRGFYDNLGDVESQVQHPTSGKTFVYVKDSLFDSKFYNSYFYMNGKWEEVPVDPAITYEEPTTSKNQGVFSIKPDNRITIDSKGQLDLSGLATDEAKLNFHGFYETQQALDAAVTNPIVDKSFAYVRHQNGAWVGKAYRHTSTGNTWQIIAPISAISLLESKTVTNTPAPIFGIYKNDDWDLDGTGIMSLKPKESEVKVEISDKDGAVQNGSYKTVRYEKGKSYISLDDSTKKLTVQHPQRIINYDSSFEAQHNSMDFEGNIYFDETSRCWMGWGVPTAAGGVDKKWTRIAHPKMSDEVKDLLKRLPPKAPYVTPGVIGDAPLWEYSSWTYVKKDDSTLPQDFRERCGAYFMTIIQDVENDTQRPQERLQICYADEQGGHCYVRRWNKGSSPGSSDQGWYPWVKISMSAKDISDHNTDHTSHRDSFKFYKVGTLDMSWATLKTKNGRIGDSDLLLLADSDGVSLDGETSITVPYTGTYRFSGRIDFDGLSTSAPYKTPQLFIYVYKTTGSTSSIVSEHAYNHTDHTKPLPPLQWKSGAIQLNEGDKIHFEIKDFKNSLDSLTELRFIPNRSFFVMEDSKTTAGSRIAETFRRTVGALNAHYNVGVNVHYNTGASGAIRVYGAAVTAQATNMNKVTG